MKSQLEDDEPTESRKISALLLDGGVSVISRQKRSFVTSSFEAPWLELFPGRFAGAVDTAVVALFHSSGRFD